MSFGAVRDDNPEPLNLPLSQAAGKVIHLNHLRAFSYTLSQALHKVSPAVNPAFSLCD